MGNLPSELTSVRYIKNGPGGQWWEAAKAGNELHIGWGSVPIELLVSGDMPAARQTIAGYSSSTQVATMDANALESLMIKPSQHIWVTIQDGYLWWCTVMTALSPILPAYRRSGVMPGWSAICPGRTARLAGGSCRWRICPAQSPCLPASGRPPVSLVQRRPY